VQTHRPTEISIAVAVVMKECPIYKLFFIGVTFFILCGFHNDERENTIVTDGVFEEYVTTDNDVYCDETFAGSCAASAAVILAFAGLLYSASIWQKQPRVFVKPKESKTACIFINRIPVIRYFTLIFY
jgi:hypothetical protein